MSLGGIGAGGGGIRKRIRWRELSRNFLFAVPMRTSTAMLLPIPWG